MEICYIFKGTEMIDSTLSLLLTSRKSFIFCWPCFLV